MKYSCGCRANLSIVSKAQVRAARSCPSCSPEGQKKAAEARAAMRESERRNMLAQASLDGIGMGHFGPLAVTEGERIGFAGTATAKTVLTTLAMMGVLHQANTVAQQENARRRRGSKP